MCRYGSLSPVGAYVPLRIHSRLMQTELRLATVVPSIVMATSIFDGFTVRVGIIGATDIIWCFTGRQ